MDDWMGLPDTGPGAQRIRVPPWPHLQIVTENIANTNNKQTKKNVYKETKKQPQRDADSEEWLIYNKKSKNNYKEM